MKGYDSPRGMFVCFAGIDGSGKTTLAQSLASTLNQRGVSAKYVWCGWRQFESPLLGPFARVVRSLLSSRRDSKGTVTKTSATASNAFRPIHEYLMLIDYLLLAVLRVKIPLMRSENLVCDRYVYDSLAGLQVDGGDVQIKERVLLSFLHWLPKPDLVFLIDLPAETAWERKRDTPSPDALEQRRTNYLALAEQHDMIIIDGRLDLDQLTNLIENKVTALIGEFH